LCVPVCSFVLRFILWCVLSFCYFRFSVLPHATFSKNFRGAAVCFLPSCPHPITTTPPAHQPTNPQTNTQAHQPTNPPTTTHQPTNPPIHQPTSPRNHQTTKPFVYTYPCRSSV
jgi:hypothetical protein